MSGNKKSNICDEFNQILHLDIELKSMKLCKYRLKFNDRFYFIDLDRRYMAEILPTQGKTLSNQSIFY